MHLNQCLHLLHTTILVLWLFLTLQGDSTKSAGVLSFQVGLGEGLAPSSATNVMARLIPE